LRTSKRFLTIPPSLRERWVALALFSLVAVLLALCPGISSALANEAGPGFRVIVHPENPLSRASRRMLATVFLKEVARWDDGTATRPVDLKPDSAARRHFSETVLNRSVRAVKSYWQQRIFSGRGVPPPELETDRSVVEYVTKHRGAIGYVAPGTELGKTKTLSIGAP
jgi:ABC-type phosphate transport system substrate-binding protein